MFLVQRDACLGESLREGVSTVDHPNERFVPSLLFTNNIFTILHNEPFPLTYILDLIKPIFQLRKWQRADSYPQNCYNHLMRRCPKIYISISTSRQVNLDAYLLHVQVGYIQVISVCVIILSTVVHAVGCAALLYYV